ncbi:unnamed protein product [Malus baccata var. baccata]
MDRRGALLASFQVIPVLLDRVREAQMHDAESQELLQAELKKEILNEAHISAYAMHLGSTKMFHTIRPFYCWPGMKREIAEYVMAERKKPFRLLQPFLIPSGNGKILQCISCTSYLPHEMVTMFGNAWHKRLLLIEFAYNNSFHSSIGMALFEALYIGPYQIVEQVGEIAYPLALPSELSKVYNMFHVSILQRYVSDLSHVIPPQRLEINLDLTYNEVPVTIFNWKDKVLKNKTV